MASSLGGKLAISSLRSEVASLQDAVAFLTKQTRDEVIPTWKYPDKVSSELDPTQLLVLFDYVDEDREKRQTAHVVLLEMIIDKLLVMLHLTETMLRDEVTDDSRASEELACSVEDSVSSFCNVLLNAHKQLDKLKKITAEKSQVTGRFSSTEEASANKLQLAESSQTQMIEQPVFDTFNKHCATQDGKSERPRLRDRELIRNPLIEAELADQKQQLLEMVKYDRRKACPTCGQKPTRKVRHKKYQCDLCSKGFSLMKYLDLHKKKIHSSSDENKVPNANHLVEGKIISDPGKGDFECPACHKLFMEEKLLIRHLHAQHKGTKYEPPKKPRPEKIFPGDDGRFKCKDCDKSFKTERILRKHMQIHSGEYTYKCKECGKGYYNIGSYRAHLSIHTGETYFTCKECGKGFPHSSSYNFHIRTAHVTEQNFHCSICNRKYKSEKYLKDHIQSVHVQPDRYKCKICNRTFGHRASLFMHAKTHKKEGEVGGRPVAAKKKAQRQKNEKIPAQQKLPSEGNHNAPVGNYTINSGPNENHNVPVGMYIPSQTQPGLYSNANPCQPQNTNHFDGYSSTVHHKVPNMAAPQDIPANSIPVLMATLPTNVSLPSVTVSYVPMSNVDKGKNLQTTANIANQSQTSTSTTTNHQPLPSVQQMHAGAPHAPLYQVPWPHQNREFSAQIPSSSNNVTLLPSGLSNFAAYNLPGPGQPGPVYQVPPPGLAVTSQPSAPLNQTN